MPVSRIMMLVLVKRTTCFEGAKDRACIQKPCAECVEAEEAFAAAGH